MRFEVVPFIVFLMILVTAGSQAALRIVPRQKGAAARVAPANAAQLVEAKVTFRNFVSCAAHLTSQSKAGGKNLRQCAREYLSPDLPDFMKRDFEQFLFFDLTISELFVCDEERERNLRHSHSDKGPVLCFDVYKGKKSDRGYVFFRESGGQMLITRVNFSTARLH